MTVHDRTATKTAESRVAAQMAELQRWHAATLGREQRILELKAEVDALLLELGREHRYPSAHEEPAAYRRCPAVPARGRPTESGVQRGSTSPVRIAKWTRPARSWMSRRRMISLRWDSTVLTLRSSALAISLVECRSATS